MTHPTTTPPAAPDSPRTTRLSTVVAVVAVLAVVAVVAVGVVIASTVLGGRSDNANGSVPVEDVAELAGSWRVVNSVGAPAAVVGEVRLRFEDDRLAVETGCNVGSGTVEVDDSHLVVGPLMSTMMGCEPPLMEQETWLFAMAAARPKVELSGPYLYINWVDPQGAQRWLGLEHESAEPTS
ncbi:META domain-containing protein [Oryzobacter telluris]|uniref:META domain-containing protein n=1 Tax=Oryzobacter telluris TaxID=3149179 RepID=UPI00370CFE7D